MGVIIPSMPVLMAVADKVRNQYPNSNPRLLNILDITVNLMKPSNLSYGHDTSDFQMQLFGGYAFSIDSIAALHKVTSPEGGLLYSGDELYKAILLELGIDANNKMDDETKFICLSKFLIFIKANRFHYDSAQIDSSYLISEIERYISRVLKNLQPVMAKLKRSIPTEYAIDTEMKNMLIRYNAKSKDRIFDAALITAIANLTLPNMFEKNRDHFLSYTQRIKMGALIGTAQLIYNSYTRLSALRSTLFVLCCTALNINGANGLEDLDPHTRWACLNAFDGFLADRVMVEKLACEIRRLIPESKLDIDFEIQCFRDNLSVIKNTLKDILSPSTNLSLPTKIATILGGILGAPLGHAFGISIANGISLTSLLVPAKVALSSNAGVVMTVVMGSTGEMAGYYVADKFIDATLEYGFGMAFQALGITMGALTGCFSSIILYDASRATLKIIWDLCTQLQQELGINLAKDANHELIKCLISLPDHLFSSQEKSKVRQITGTKSLVSSRHSLFSDDSDSEYQNSPLMDEDEFHLLSRYTLSSSSVG